MAQHSVHGLTGSRETSLAVFSRSFLSVPVFLQRTSGALSELSTQEHRLRKSRNLAPKKLLEEVLPIAVFLKYFDTPSRTPRCRYCPGNQPFDAQLKVTGREVELGLLKSMYYLEVTTAIPHDDHLVREALHRHGFVVTSGSHRRVGSRRRGREVIETSPEVRDYDFPVAQLASLVEHALDRKQAQDHPNPAMLIVVVSPDRPLGCSDWAKVQDELTRRTDSSGFAGHYVVDPWSNAVVPILGSHCQERS